MSLAAYILCSLFSLRSQLSYSDFASFPDPDTLFKPVCIPYTPVYFSEAQIGDYDFSMLTLSETGAAVDASVDWAGPGFSRQPLTMQPVVNEKGGRYPRFFDYTMQGAEAADC